MAKTKEILEAENKELRQMLKSVEEYANKREEALKEIKTIINNIRR